MTTFVPRFAIILLVLFALSGSAMAQNPSCLDARDGFPSCAIDVDNGGMVGVGTATPEALLDVRGDAFFAPNDCDIDGSGSVDIHDILAVLDFIAGRVTPTAGSFASHDVTGDGRVSLDDVGFCLQRFGGADPLVAKQAIEAGYGMTGPSSFQVSAGMQVNGDATMLGNVTVGSSTAESSLSVFGSIVQRGSLLHADYVFEPGYELESIDEHAVFMQRHKHLPAVPARKVDASGLEVVEFGAHQRGILEELEKAHLYIAALHETVARQAERLARLEAAISEKK